MRPETIPRLPVFGWHALRGERNSVVPCMLDLPGTHYTTSGRASILLALETLKVGPSCRVLLPTYHCPTMVAPTTTLRGEPVFYPINDSGAPDLAWLDAQDLRDVRVMLVAHFFGVPQPMSEVRRWCIQRDIALIEDCAHSLFGRSGERPIGAWGDIAVGSLTKFLPVPEGGCIVFNGARHLPPLQPCRLDVQARAAVDILEVSVSQGQMQGFNRIVSSALAGVRRMYKRPVGSVAGTGEANGSGGPLGSDTTIDTNLAHRQLAIPCRWVADNLPRDRIVHERRSNFLRLHRELLGRRGMRPLLSNLPVDCVPYVFPLWVDEPDPGYEALRKLGMPVFRWDRLWPGVPNVRGDLGKQWSHHVIQLACHQDISSAKMTHFIECLLELYARSK